uniref:Uncharacterized protein n=1 Tax=Cannabis sativa TaxID=3483 RepID=A0A803PIM7_CANSA
MEDVEKAEAYTENLKQVKALLEQRFAKSEVKYQEALRKSLLVTLFHLRKINKDVLNMLEENDRENFLQKMLELDAIKNATDEVVQDDHEPNLPNDANPEESSFPASENALVSDFQTDIPPNSTT